MTNGKTTLGWQGITIEAPADWSLVGVTGDERKGYFRVESPVASGVEVRWESAGGKKPNLAGKVREFLKNLEKASRRNRLEFSSKVKNVKTDGDSVSFVWKADRIGQGRIVYCEKCDRVIIAQVIADREENVSRFAGEILDSLNDHREDGWANWGLYGFRFAVPPKYRIEKQTLMSGYISLSFKSRAMKLVVDRWGLAKTLMEKDTFEGWYRKDVVPEFAGYKVDISECEIRGLPGLEISGRRRGITQALKAFAYKFTLYPFPDRISGRVWLDEEANRIFGVWATHREGDDIAELVGDTIESDP